MLEMEAFVIEFSFLSAVERWRREGKKKNLMDDFLRRKLSMREIWGSQAEQTNREMEGKEQKKVEVYRAFEEKNSRNL